jgi:hypoxia up-regulated 1
MMAKISVVKISTQRYKVTLLNSTIHKQVLLSNSIGKNLKNDAKAMARLLGEARRCKLILSANEKVYASVENLNGVDFKATVDRATLERLNSELIQRVTAPIQRVLERSNVTMNQVNSVVLFGGGVRVPAIQKVVGDFVGKDKVARNVDGDEAAVLGAVLHAAKVSASFRLGMSVEVSDVCWYGVFVKYADDAGGVVGKWVVGEGSLMGRMGRKTVTFRRSDDFLFSVGVGTKGSVADVVDVRVEGIKEVVEKYKGKMKDMKVKVTMGLSDSGLLQFSDAHVSFEIRVDEEKKDANDKGDSLKDSVLNFFGKKKNGEAEEGDGGKEDVKEGTDGEEKVEVEEKEIKIV